MYTVHTPVHTYNYLGVEIDDCLTCESFLKQKCNRVNSKVYQLGKLWKFITKDVACLIYKQTILSVIEYADIMSLVLQRILRGYKRCRTGLY